MLFCVNIHGSYKLSKTVGFFGPPCIIIHYYSSVIFVNENENGEKRENNEFVNEN